MRYVLVAVLSVAATDLAANKPFPCHAQEGT